jgi:hypothetical protein
MSDPMTIARYLWERIASWQAESSLLAAAAFWAASFHATQYGDTVQLRTATLTAFVVLEAVVDPELDDAPLGEELIEPHALTNRVSSTAAALRGAARRAFLTRIKTLLVRLLADLLPRLRASSCPRPRSRTETVTLESKK